MINVYIEKMKDPLLKNQIELTGGMMDPRQLKAMGKPVQGLLEEVMRVLQVWPSDDIVVDGHVVDQKKRFGAKAFQSFLDKLERRKPEFGMTFDIPKYGGYLGNLKNGNQVTSTQILYPTKQEHIGLSGPSGLGKTVAGRLFVENIYTLTDARIILLDPTLQSSGIGVANTNPQMLKRLKELGISNYTQGFPVRIYTPGSSSGLPLPSNLEDLFKGPERIAVISFKAATDEQRCQITTDVAKAIIEHFNDETDQIRLFLVMEEAPSFMPKNLEDKAAEIARVLRGKITRIVQEKRKYGVSCYFIAQTSGAFQLAASDIRKNIRTWIYMRTTDDTELKKMPYEVAKNVETLGVGEAVISNPDFPPVKIYLRPSFSEIRELSSGEIKEINRRYQSAPIVPKRQPELSELEKQAMRIISGYYRNSHEGILLTELDSQLGLKRGRQRQKLYDSLENKELIKKISVPGRGNPMRIIPNDCFVPDSEQ